MPSELAAALAKVQAELPRIDKSKTAKIPGKEGRQGYEYNYADLADVSEAILPILGKHGLAFTAWPTVGDEGKFILAYSLLHESGESRDGVYPLPAGVAVQQLGSAITYGRRYCLCAVTGAAADEDDDGAAASVPRTGAASKGPKATPVAAAPVRNNGTTLDPKKRAAIFAQFGELGIDDPDVQRGLLADILGRPVNSRKGLTNEDADKVIPDLRNRPRPAREAAAAS